MFKVYKRIGHNFVGKSKELIGEFATFNSAHEFAQNTVCKDVVNEGGKSLYWFSDEGDANTAYKVVIDGENWFKD